MKINEETTVSEEQVLFNKLSYEDQELIIKIMKTLQPCELSCEVEEKKIPEKIKSNGKEFYCDNIDSWIDKEKTSAYCEYLMNKYNDLIDYLKSKGDE